jgi:hypothetical protein
LKIASKEKIFHCIERQLNRFKNIDHYLLVIRVSLVQDAFDLFEDKSMEISAVLDNRKLALDNKRYLDEDH